MRPRLTPTERSLGEQAYHNPEIRSANKRRSPEPPLPHSERINDPQHLICSSYHNETLLHRPIATAKLQTP